jgi:hypothetical protein
VILLASKYYSAMRKSYFLLIPLLIWGCEKTYDNLIDTSTENFQVTDIIFIDHNPPVYDLKNPEDSLLKLRVIFTSQSEVSKTYFDIYASDNSRLNSSPVEMQEVTENIFENQFILLSENPIGNYTVRFSASGIEGNTKQVAIGSFYFNNGQDNLPPEIFNTVIEPDTAVVNDTTVIFASVGAMDPNGANDIEEVYFVVYRPDGTTNNSKILLYDDGKLENGDKIAGDGIYSRLIQVDQSNQKGIYRFEFRAKDRSGELSNIINHFVLIQ